MKILTTAIKIHLLDLIYLLFLIIIGFKISFRIEKVLDILFNDETVNLEKGINIILKKELDGMLYFYWYKFLSLFTSNNIDLYYLNCNLLLIIPALLLFLLLKTMKINSLTAFIFSMILMISHVNVYVYPFITKFVLCFLLAGLIFLFKIHDTGFKLQFAVFISFFLIYIRPEYILSFFLLIAVLTMYLMLNLRKFNIQKISKLLLPVLILAVIVIRYNPSNGPRSFIAYAQHYIRDINERSGINNDDIYEKLLHDLFGQNNSVLKIALNQPGIFFEHMQYNLKRIPEQISDLFPYFIPDNKNTFIEKLFYFLALICFTIILFMYFKNKKRRYFNYDHAIWLLFCLPSLISIVFIYPRSHYMIMIESMMLIFLSFTTSEFLKEKKINTSYVFETALVLGISSSIFFPNRFMSSSIHETSCTNLGILNSINIVSDKQKINLLSVAAGISPFLNKNINNIGAKYFDQPYCEFIEKYNINMVLVNESILNHRKIIDNKVIDKFRNDTNFVVLDINKCREQLIVRKNILKK